MNDVAQITAYFIFDALVHVPVEQMRALVSQLSVTNVLDLLAMV